MKNDNNKSDKNNWIRVNKTSLKTLLHGKSVLVKHSGGVNEAVYCNMTKSFNEPYYGQTEIGKFNNVTHFMPMPHFS